MTKLCTLLLAFSTACSVLGSPVIDAAQLGDAHLRRQETSSATSAMSTTTSSSSSAATTTTAAPTASPSDLSQASIEVISGLRAASDGVRQVKNESLASNNTAVAALADIAQVSILSAELLTERLTCGRRARSPLLELVWEQCMRTSSMAVIPTLEDRTLRVNSVLLSSRSTELRWLCPSL